MGPMKLAESCKKSESSSYGRYRRILLFLFMFVFILYPLQYPFQNPLKAQETENAEITSDEDLIPIIKFMTNTMEKDLNTKPDPIMVISAIQEFALEKNLVVSDERAAELLEKSKTYQIKEDEFDLDSDGTDSSREFDWGTGDPLDSSPSSPVSGRGEEDHAPKGQDKDKSKKNSEDDEFEALWGVDLGGASDKGKDKSKGEKGKEEQEVIAVSGGAIDKSKQGESDDFWKLWGADFSASSFPTVPTKPPATTIPDFSTWSKFHIALKPFNQSENDNENKEKNQAIGKSKKDGHTLIEDDKDVPELDKDPHFYSDSLGFSGLPNTSATTCFMNGAIQTLAVEDETLFRKVTSRLLRKEKTHGRSSDDQHQRAIMAQKRLKDHLQALIVEIRSAGGQYQGQMPYPKKNKKVRKALRKFVRDFRKILKLKKETFSGSMNPRIPGRQQDPAEFLVKVFDYTNYSKHLGLKYHDRVHWDNKKYPEKGVVSKNAILDLPIRPKRDEMGYKGLTVKSVQEAFDEFTSEEVVPGSKGSREWPGVKAIKILNAPPILFVTLKRFAMSAPSFQADRLGHKVEVGPLVVPLYSKKGVKIGEASYQPVAVEVHKGVKSANFGHYYTYIKGHGGWVKHNDSAKPYLVNEQMAMEDINSNGYVIRYQLKKMKKVNQDDGQLEDGDPFAVDGTEEQDNDDEEFENPYIRDGILKGG